MFIRCSNGFTPIALLAVAGFCLLASPSLLAAATPKSISVSGNLNGGAKVTASCTLSTTGQTSGTGKFFGPTFSYAFRVTKVATEGKNVVLSGNFTGTNATFTLTTAYPSGAQTFGYVVNGHTTTYSGTGTVTVK